MYTIIIKSNGINEIEWTEEITSKSQQGARSKATRWIKRNIFEADYQQIKKSKVSEFSRRETWILI